MTAGHRSSLFDESSILRGFTRLNCWMMSSSKLYLPRRSVASNLMVVYRHSSELDAIRVATSGVVEHMTAAGSTNDKGKLTVR